LTIDEKEVIKWGGIGLSAILGWVLSAFRYGRSVEKYDNRIKTVEKAVVDLKKEATENKAEFKEDVTRLQGDIDAIECIEPGDCLASQKKFHELIQVQFVAQQAQFTAGTREFDEIKGMIKDYHDAGEKRFDTLMKRHDDLVSQLLSERGKANQ